MSDMRRSAKTPLWVLGVLGGLVAVAVAVVVLVIVGVISYLEIDERVGYQVTGASCEEVSDTVAFISMTITPLDPDVVSVHVDDFEVQGGQLSGVATLARDASLSSLTTDEELAMSADFDDHESWLVLEGESRDIVLRVERVGDAEVRVEGFKLWFSYGEPAFVQSIPLTAEWGQGCIAELAG